VLLKTGSYKIYRPVKLEAEELMKLWKNLLPEEREKDCGVVSDLMNDIFVSHKLYFAIDV